MEENIYDTDNQLIDNEPEYILEKPSRYWLGWLAGVTVSIALGALVAALCCYVECFSFWFAIIPAIIIGVIVKNVSRRTGIITGLISALCGVCATITYVAIMESGGYVWEDGTPISDNLFLYLGISAAICGWIGLKD